MTRFRSAIISMLAATFCFAATGFSGEQPGDCLQGMSLPPDYRPFSPDSPWNTPIPETPEIDLLSDLMIENLKGRVKRLKGDMTKWTTPLFVIDSESCRKRNVRTSRDTLNPLVDPDGNGVAEGLPIPAGVWPDPGDDGHMLLVDPILGQSWDYSKVHRFPGSAWIASRVDIWDLEGPGYREPFIGKSWRTYGARGSGMPLIAGLIRPEEIEAGEINHALVFASPVNRKKSLPGAMFEACRPASRTDGKGVGPKYIPEGARLQLDPALDLESLNLSPETKVIARTLQKYGMYNCDNSETFKLYFQNLGPDGGKWKTLGDFEDLANIPLDSFRVLKCDVVVKQ